MLKYYWLCLKKYYKKEEEEEERINKEKWRNEEMKKIEENEGDIFKSIFISLLSFSLSSLNSSSPFSSLYFSSSSLSTINSYIIT